MEMDHWDAARVVLTNNRYGIPWLFCFARHILAIMRTDSVGTLEFKATNFPSLQPGQCVVGNERDQSNIFDLGGSTAKTSCFAFVHSSDAMKTCKALTCGRDGALPRAEVLEELVVLAAQRTQRLAMLEQQLGELLLFASQQRKARRRQVRSNDDDGGHER